MTGKPDSDAAPPPHLPEWQALSAHRKALESLSIRSLFADNPDRFAQFSLSAAGLHLDYSKNRLTRKTLDLLNNLARARGLDQSIANLFSGAIVNQTEQRAALHTALRAPADACIEAEGENVVPRVHETLARMDVITRKLQSGQWLGRSGQPIRDVVCIGIGGSHLGPKLAATALRPYWKDTPCCHFVANIDGAQITSTLASLNADTTLVVVASKTFTTRETLANARTARDWFLQQGASEADLAHHLLAVTADTRRAVDFGIHEGNILPVWNWVGGRYSLWSAIGLPIALCVGMDHFRRLLAGAHAMDEHFRQAPLEGNMPALLALLGIWYRNFWGTSTHAVVPYDHSLRNLPAYLQQLDMESCGKSVRNDGTAVEYETGAVVWGSEGSNGQHAFHQLLHQGTTWIPVDFIIPLRAHHALTNQHAQLVASCLSQSKALMKGRSSVESFDELVTSGMSETDARALAPHRAHPGNRPSNTIFFEQLTPETLGALIALYEHKVFVQGAIWDINPFDQWGVELGKQLTGRLLAQLTGQESPSDQDSSTAALCARYRQANPNR